VEELAAELGVALEVEVHDQLVERAVVGGPLGPGVERVVVLETPLQLVERHRLGAVGGDDRRHPLQQPAQRPATAVDRAFEVGLGLGFAGVLGGDVDERLVERRRLREQVVDVALPLGDRAEGQQGQEREAEDVRPALTLVEPGRVLDERRLALVEVQVPGGVVEVAGEPPGVVAHLLGAEHPEGEHRCLATEHAAAVDDGGRPPGQQHPDGW
jgi:hypothetical protein